MKKTISRVFMCSETMAHGLNAMLKRSGNSDSKTGIGSRRIFAPQFKLQVLDSYRNDADCKGNQRATARKYGIHRRQIQKWLQVENNLRSSVLKNKCGDMTAATSPEARKCGLELALSHGDRQRDDVQSQRQLRTVTAEGEGSEGSCVATAAADKRVPDIPQPVYATLPAPLAAPATVLMPVPIQHEWRRGSPVDTTPLAPQRSPPVSLPLDLRRSPDPTAPIDLSLKPRYPHRDDLHAAPSLAPVPSPLPLISPTLLSPPDPDVWDLSTKATHKRPYEDTVTSSSAAVSRPVKLFKPYLDHIIEEQEQSTSPQPPSDTFSPPLNHSPDIKPVILTNLDSGEHYSIYHHHNNNNNNNYQPDYQVDYTLYNDYYHNGNGLYFAREPFAFVKGSAGCMKQRQSYSLDFKLSAIECYYSDAVCRGNQRAVASKFKIHRRQVQKWLKQEDQLRQRMQPLHIVR